MICDEITYTVYSPPERLIFSTSKFPKLQAVLRTEVIGSKKIKIDEDRN